MSAPVYGLGCRVGWLAAKCTLEFGEIYADRDWPLHGDAAANRLQALNQRQNVFAVYPL